MGGRILILEDDRDLREVMRDWLEAVFRGCEVIAAPNNGGTVPRTEARPPRVILVDVDTVEARRTDLIGRLKAAAPQAEIIALTMDDHQPLREDLIRSGARFCLRKADMSDRLPRMLTDILEPELGPTPQTGRKTTILCIEDELDMIRLIELTLRRGPFRVLSAVSGRQGLEIARRVRPDVVLLDLMMPDLDGWEVARRMRSDPALEDVSIIALSVMSPTSYPAWELPVDDYVTKPFRADDLVRRVDEAVRVIAQ